MNTAEALKIKKRIMFIKGDDVYFIAYNILLAIAELDCSSQARPFKDYRKLSFLIDFIADPRLTAIVAQAKGPSRNKFQVYFDLCQFSSPWRRGLMV